MSRFYGNERKYDDEYMTRRQDGVKVHLAKREKHSRFCTGKRIFGLFVERNGLEIKGLWKQYFEAEKNNEVEIKLQVFWRRFGYTRIFLFFLGLPYRFFSILARFWAHFGSNVQVTTFTLKRVDPRIRKLVLKRNQNTTCQFFTFGVHVYFVIVIPWLSLGDLRPLTNGCIHCLSERSSQRVTRNAFTKCRDFVNQCLCHFSVFANSSLATFSCPTVPS